MESSQPRIIGRYALYDEIASGGMATVYLGRLIGPVGFARTVAIKCLHKQLARDPEFVAMFLDEARLAARIHHPNVVGIVDVVAMAGELFLVMDYIHGETLARILRGVRPSGERIPPPIVAAIIGGMLDGLHAAHEARGEDGSLLHIVHRDVSPQNVLVGTDGIARVADFGVAKAVGRMQTTTEGKLKGKFAYMSPEQIGGKPVDRRSDVYAAGVVLWESLTGQRLFPGDSHAEVLARILAGNVASPRTVVPEIPVGLEEVVLCALDADPSQRFATAREMLRALERALAPARAFEVSEWLQSAVGQGLAERAALLTEVEARSRSPAEPAQDLLAKLDSKAAPQTLSAPSTTSLVTSGGSSLAMTVTYEVPSRWKRPLQVLGVIGVAVLGLALVARRARAPAVPVVPIAAAASSPLSSPTPSVQTSAPTVASATTPVSSSAAAPSSSPPAVAPRAASPGRKPAPKCIPPYTVDADGHRHFKIECL